MKTIALSKLACSRIAFSGLAALALAFSPGTAMGQALTPEGANDNEWRFSVTPYMFLPVTTSGTSTVDGNSVKVDLGLGDVLENLNGAFSARAEAWKNDFGIILDGYYVNIGGEETIGLPGPLGGRVGVDVDMRQGWIDLLGGYRVAHGPYDASGRRYAIDIQAGARHNWIRQEIDADLTVDIGPGLGFQTSLGGTESWWEPVVGVRAAMQINDRWTAGARADVGGFGVNDDTLQWKVLAGFDYRPWEQTSLRFGWQMYGIEYDTERPDGKFEYDVFQTGPYLALSFRF